MPKPNARQSLTEKLTETLTTIKEWIENEHAIDGVYFDEESIRDEIVEVLAEKYDRQKLISGILAVGDLIEESRGVDGLHLNGNVAEWGELRTGGMYEDWLSEFDEALKIARQE